MPSPPALTEMQSLLLARQLTTDPRPPIIENTQRFGPIWQSRCDVDRAPVTVTWLMGPAGNERVLAPRYKDDFSVSESYGQQREPLLGDDLADRRENEPGPDAAVTERQRLLAPLFVPRFDSRYKAATLSSIGLHLSNLTVSQPLDLARELKRISLYTLVQGLVGAADHELPRLNQLFEFLASGLSARVRLPIPGTKFYRARSAGAKLGTYVREKLAAYRHGQAEPPLLLAQLLHEHGPALLADDTLATTLVTLILAGYDTTASLLTSALVALGNSPEVFRHLRDELRTPLRSLRPDSDPPSLGDGEPTYFGAVLLELERLYPPLLFAIRSVRRDFEFGGYPITRGQKVAYSAYYTGRLPELFDDPLTFTPERFLGESGSGVLQPPAYSLVGFGGGPRGGLGKRFASLQLRLLLIGLFQRFDVEFLEQESDVIFFSPTLQRKHGYTVRLYRRHLSVPTMAQL